MFASTTEHKRFAASGI